MELVQKVFNSDLLFKKKSGAELRRAAATVAKTYGPGYKGDPAGDCAARGGSSTYRVLHLTGHPLPRDFTRACLCGLLAGVWLALYPVEVKIRSLLNGLIYSFVEYTFTFFERGRPYTAVAMFLVCLMWSPLLLDVYGSFLGSSPVAYVLLFPFNIWVGEVITGHLLIYLWGYNVAWAYDDYADEYFNGTARVGHGVWWLGMGALCYLLYPLVQAMTTFQ